jgi:hypothetical protein
LERIINMVIQQVMRRLVNKGIGAGLNAATKGRNRTNASPQTPEEISPADAAAAQNAKLAAKRARKMARLGRKF